MLGKQKNLNSDKFTGYSYEGKPITLSKRQGSPIKKPRHRIHWYPEETKIEAATLWAATRNIDTVSEYVKVSTYIIRKWQQEPWWNSVVSRVVKDHNDQLDQSLTQVIHKAAELMIDRLENGDERINFKTGERFKLPLDSRSLAVTMGIVFDKRQLLRGEATSRTEAVTSSQKLEELKEAFLKFHQATEIEGVYEKPIQQEDAEAGRQGQEALLIDGPRDTTDGGMVSGEAELQPASPDQHLSDTEGVSG